MRRSHEIWIAGAVMAALAAGFLATAGPPPPAPARPGTFSFATLGDAPYSPWEDLQFRLVLQDLGAHDLAWVLHVGDIFGLRCTDDRYRWTLDRFRRLPHPVIYALGDNEWADCWENRSGGFAPAERLARVRQIFFSHPTRSLGGRALPLISQGGTPFFSEYVENARLTHQGVVVATMHLVGSWNGLRPFPRRTQADDVEVERRTAAAAAWLRETFADARAANASAVVLAWHANLALERPAHDPYRQAFEPFVTTLQDEVEQFAGPVVAIHGDGHEYTVDHPLVRRGSGERLVRFTRVQVPGSPAVGWVRVTVTPGPEPTFAFESRVIPRWKYW
jgi:hypothetical protein